MPKDPSYFYCERCGAVTFLGGTMLGAHYCPRCRLYTCHDCWDSPAHRCVDCAADSGKRAKGIRVAREMLASLRGVRGELSAISAREAKGDEPSTELDIERRLLDVKSASLAAAVAFAVRDAQPRHAVTAASLRRAASHELERTSSLLAVPSRPRGRASVLGSWLAALALPKLDSGWLRMAMPVALFLVIGSAVGVLLVTRPPEREGGVSGITPTPEGQVAGGLPTQEPRPTPTNTPRVSPVEPLRITFDDLITDSTPAGWEVLGGGTAAGVPYPNAVDRSVQLRTNSDGTQASLCTPLPEGDTRFVTVDLFARPLPGTAVTLDGGNASFGLEIGPSLNAVIQPSGAALSPWRLDAADWYRVGFSLDPDADLVEVSLSHSEAAGDFRMVPLPSGWGDASPADARLCISAPPGPGEELYVDNVIIE